METKMYLTMCLTYQVRYILPCQVRCFQLGPDFRTLVRIRIFFFFFTKLVRFCSDFCPRTIAWKFPPQTPTTTKQIQNCIKQWKFSLMWETKVVSVYESSGVYSSNVLILFPSGPISLPKTQPAPSPPNRSLLPSSTPAQCHLTFSLAGLILAL